jgi:hypothetical protein
MRKNRFWIEIIPLCAGVAFGLGCALTFVGAVGIGLIFSMAIQLS